MNTDKMSRQTALSELTQHIRKFDDMRTEERGYAKGEKLAGNVVKEAHHNGTAAGLLIAINHLLEAKAALAAQDGPDEMDEPLYRVVCAAIRHQTSGLVIAGHRHYDSVMRDVILALTLMEEVARNTGWYSCEQGFLNNKGEFITRAQAWVIARKAGQIRRLVGSQRDSETGELFSENLY